MNERRILKNKLFLYLTEFFAGMSVMAIELGAQRLLAPYFSSSQIVWTIVIGTIMIAMALGNVYGGRKADKDPNPDKLYARIIVSGAWIALIPFLGKYIIVGVSALLILTVHKGFLIVAATISCLILFIFPLFLLGTTTPCLAKYCTTSLDDSGKTVGYLNAFNTVGSIIGTFTPTFITIPTIGTNWTFLIFAIILLLLAFIYFISFKVFKPRMAVSVILLIISIIFGHNSHFAFWNNDLMYEGESIYNYLQVYEDKNEVSLSTNVLFGVQSVYYKEKGLHYSHYYDYDLAALLMANSNKKEEVNVLILGMGSGTYAKQIERYFDNVNVTGVEIDEKITYLAETYFNQSKDIDVYTYDGRAFLNVINDKYDVILVDAYQDITIPFQMSSIEFFTLVKDHLTSDGVMVVNLNMRSDEDKNINYYLCDTINNVFDYCYTVNVSSSSNRELFASNNENMLDIFKENIELVDDSSLAYFMNNYVYKRLEEFHKGDLLLTDDKAPVELLGISVIDTLINESVEYYINIVKEQGIKGLLDYLG